MTAWDAWAQRLELGCMLFMPPSPCSGLYPLYADDFISSYSAYIIVLHTSTLNLHNDVIYVPDRFFSLKF